MPSKSIKFVFILIEFEVEIRFSFKLILSFVLPLYAKQLTEELMTVKAFPFDH